VIFTSLRNCTDDLSHFCNSSSDDRSPLTGLTAVGNVDSRGWLGRKGCARWACLQRIHNNMAMAGRLEGDVEGTASVSARERTGTLGGRYCSRVCKELEIIDLGGVESGYY
jgi:hypothetical protein